MPVPDARGVSIAIFGMVVRVAGRGGHLKCERGSQVLGVRGRLPEGSTARRKCCSPACAMRGARARWREAEEFCRPIRKAEAIRLWFTEARALQLADGAAKNRHSHRASRVM